MQSNLSPEYIAVELVSRSPDTRSANKVRGGMEVHLDDQVIVTVRSWHGYLFFSHRYASGYIGGVRDLNWADRLVKLTCKQLEQQLQPVPA